MLYFGCIQWETQYNLNSVNKLLVHTREVTIIAGDTVTPRLWKKRYKVESLFLQTQK